MNEEERNKVIGHIKEQVSIHGSMDIISAFTNMKVRVSDLDIQRIAGMITKDGQYIKHESPQNKDNYYVTLNPNYKKPKLSDRKPYVDWAIKD